MEKVKAFWAASTTNKVIIIASVAAIGAGVWYVVKKMKK